jgi:hypothetical protein
MRFLVNYIRQIFCKHDFEKEENYNCIERFGREIIQSGTKVSLICKKCGYYKSFWKF